MLKQKFFIFKEKKRFMKLGLAPTSILGRKRRYKGMLMSLLQ